MSIEVAVIVSDANSSVLRGRSGQRNMGALGFCCQGCADPAEMRIMREAVYLFTCLFSRFHRGTFCLYIKLGCTFSGIPSICPLVSLS